MGRSPTDILKASGLRYITHRWRPFPTFADLLTRQGTHRGVKTLALEAPDQLVLVALRAEDELDYGKLARALGVDRDPITPAASGRVQQTLGVEPGFESILTDEDVPRFVDERVLALDRAVISSGRNDRLFELGPADLVSASGATVADLATESEGSTR
jgi:Cys-tRNA(Pro)/Cys-tRNA(Cys) deacylase